MVNHSRLSGLLLPVCVLAITFGGCNKNKKGGSTEKLMKSDPEVKVPKVDPTLCDTKGKKTVTSDLNHDQKPDVWRLYKNVKEGQTTLEVLSCRQVDFNFDGKKDYAVAYTKKGATAFEKFDFDFDGRFDAFYQFDKKTGKVFEIQRESGFDGRYDIQEIYDDKGTLTSVKHDRNADGEPDMWEQYVEGDLVAILYDDDFDNKVDRREEIKVKKPKKPSPGNDVAGSGDDGGTTGDGGETPGDAEKPAGDDKPDSGEKSAGDKKAAE